MPAIEQKTETLVGELLSHRVFNAHGWGVGELVRKGEKGARQTVSITGKLVGVRVGDVLELAGAYFEHPKWGRQFKVARCNVARPEGPEGIVKWLASRLPDVGEKRARALCERFGDALWDVIEQQPRRLREVDGITAARSDAIVAAYARYRGERDHMILLRGWGLTDGQIARCLSRFGQLDEVVRELKQNPYLLAQEVELFGFVRADAVALRMGVRTDAPERIRAAVEYVLEQGAGDGHCYLAGRALQRIAAELLHVSESLVGPAIKAAADGGRIVRRGWRIYPKKLDAAEQACASALLRLLGREAA
jgi:exodeoxyribonuclease V alpha subunit